MALNKNEPLEKKKKNQPGTSLGLMDREEKKCEGIKVGIRYYLNS